MKALEVFLKIVLLLVLPTPKNLREFFGMVNALIAGKSESDTRTYSASQWDEIRKARDAKKR